MKYHSIFPLLIALTLSLFLPTGVKAGMLPKYPIFGYHAENHICQIKQRSADAPVYEDLLGYYSNLRECRRENPEILFYTGEGIVIWFGILIIAILFHYIIYPKFKKRNKVENNIYFIKDIVAIGMVIFFLILWQHYFNIPHAYINYTSDIDHIIYSTLIYRQTPTLFGITYMIILIIRSIIAIKNNKEKK